MKTAANKASKPHLLISLMAALSLSQVALGARAAGLIMIDPAFGPMPMRTAIGGIVRPPATITPPVSTRPVLHGGVSFGLRLESQEIKVEITDQVARTYIVQTFANDSDRNVAGTYLFPLPVDTTFSSFSLHIDGKPVEGKILEAAEARTQYEAIVRQMVDPGLLEYADYKTVRARIFPIPAHGTKKVELEYTQLLKTENGLLKYRFPLKGDAQAQGQVEESKINVKIAGKQGLRTIWSPSHAVDIKREDNNRARVAFAAHGEAGTDKDFLLYYSVSDKDVQANLLTHKTSPGEDGYFMLSLAPPVKNQIVLPKDIVLVADTSGSMQGEKIEQTKKALKYVVNALSAGDRFGIVQFNTDADSFKSTLVSASSENKKAAENFINDLEPRGGTNISDALSTGVSLLNSNETRPAYLVLMTDGEPTVGETTLAGVLKGVKPKRDLRLFDFGVGYDVNTRLLTQLAEEHHGTSQFLEPGESLETALSAFYNKIKSPVLSDCQISYSGVTVKDVYPRAVKDIFAGSQVLLLGRYKNGGKATVTVTGKVNGQVKTYNFPLQYAESEAAHGYLPRLWAMRRIAHLTEAAQQNNDNREVVDEIVALSKKYGIISAYTSFLATDPNEGRPGRLAGPGGRPTPQWQNLDRRVVRGATFASVGPMAAPAPSAVAFSAPGAKSFHNAAYFQRFPSNSAAGGAGGASSGISNGATNLTSAEVQASGAQAVSRAKKIALLKDSTVAGDDSVDGRIKQIGNKTFQLAADGQSWIDSDYKGEKAEEVKFASSRYFELARTSSLFASYMGAGKQVTFIVNGKVFKVTE